MSQSKILLESGTNELEIVEFYVDEPGYRGHYGLNVAKVVEIIRNQPVTSMPQMRHPSVRGAFAHRNGRIVPLIDLAMYIGTEPTEYKDCKIIITEFNTVVTSFLVSGVNRIYRLSWTDVEPPDKFLQRAARSSITGVVKIDGRVIFLLDLEAIVADLHPDLAIRMNTMDMEENTDPNAVFRILHVDDSGSIRKLVLRMLEKTGFFDVPQCNDGLEGWNFLCAARDQAQAEGVHITKLLQGIITDIEMPNMDGLTLCRKIKEDPVLKELPVAVFSSMINESLSIKARSVGADAEFTKPDLQVLSEKMLEMVRQNRRG